MRINNVIRNMISELLLGVVGTIFPFLVRTCIIKYLGSEYMGLNSLCSSVLYVLSAADLGVANAFAFRLYKPIAIGDSEEVCRLLEFYRKVYSAIGLFILCIGVAILPFFKCFISQNIPDGINVYLVFFLYLMNTVISYTVFAYKNLIFIADQKKIYESGTLLIAFVLLYTGQILSVLVRKYYISVCMLPLHTLFTNILRNEIAKRKYPDYIPHGSVSGEVIAELKRDIFSVAVYKFRDLSRDAFDSIVISAFLGLIVLSDYQNYGMIKAVPVWVLGMLYAVLLPSVGNFAISNSLEDVYNIYKKNAFIILFLSGWFAICYCFLVQDVIVIWLGMDFRLSWMTVVLLSVYIYLQGEIVLIKITRESIGLWNRGKVWAGIEMMVNLVLNVVLVSRIGVEGIVLATLISMLFIGIPVENRIIFRQYFIGKGTDKLKRAVINMVWMICTACIAGLLCSIAPHAQYISFAYKLCVCLLIPPVSCTLCFRQTEEFRFVKEVAVGLLRKHQ